MGLSLVSERFVSKRIVIENSAENVIEGTFSLPDRMPAIGRGLYIKAHPSTVSVQARDGQVIFEGTLGAELLYTHFEEQEAPVEDGRDERDYPEDEVADEDLILEEDRADAGGEVIVVEHLHSVEDDRALPFAYALELPGANEDSPIETDVQVVSCSFTVRPDHRGVDVNVLVSFSAQVTDTVAHRIATDARGLEDIEVQTRKTAMINLLGEGAGSVEVTGMLPLAGRAVPEKILLIEAEPIVTETTVADGEVELQGNVTYRLFYVGKEGAGPQWAEWSRALPFELSIPVEGAKPGGSVRVKKRTRRSQARTIDDEDGRVLEVVTPIDFDVTVEQVRHVSLITGMESESREVAVRESNLRLTERVGDTTQVEHPTAVLEIGEGQAPIERILFGTARVAVDDIHVLGDKVAVELHADVDLMYIGRTADQGSVQSVSWPKAMTVDMEIPLTGAEPGLERRVQARVADVQFDLLNRHNVDVQLRIEAQVALDREIDVDVIDEAVEVPAAEGEIPTYTYVVAQTGDTVWKLAAYYRSHTDDILAANDWLESEDSDVPSGRKVCVPRSRQ